MVNAHLLGLACVLVACSHGEGPRPRVVDAATSTPRPHPELVPPTGPTPASAVSLDAAPSTSTESTSAKKEALADAADVLDDLHPQLLACYEAARAKLPDLSGAAKLRLEVSSTGVVEAAEVQVSTLPESVTDCVLARVKAAKFVSPGPVGAIWVAPLSFTAPDGTPPPPAAAPANLSKVIASMNDALHTCTDDAKSASVKGVAKLAVRIDDKGHVTSVEARHSTMPDAVTSCIVKIFRGARFDPMGPYGGSFVVPVAVTKPK